MSLDAGGLAQMTYNHAPFGGGLGMPGSGFASRGKAPNMKRLSVAPPSQIATIDENQPAPRTSRSHLLAGLRTAPKSPTYPASGPPAQIDQRLGLDASRYATNEPFSPRGMPMSSSKMGFGNQVQTPYKPSSLNQFLSPDQVLAPPAINLEDDYDSQMDPSVYEELVRTNQYLAQQQMRLQQQLINVTQQYRNINLGQQAYQQQMPAHHGQAFNGSHMHHLQQNIVQPMHDQPGVYMVYNQLTGQMSYQVDQNYQQAYLQQHEAARRATFPSLDLSHSPPPPTPTFRAQVSPPPPESASVNNWRSISPPKTTPSPPQEEATPLPPPSANAFRANHRKSLTLSNTFNNPVADGSKSTALKLAGTPSTPVTGLFGPGQGTGEHPLRQPRGPPSLEELVAKPTTKFEGSKNFATRQRRRAVHNLVRAGLERRTASRGHGSVDSAEGMTPTSDGDINFACHSDNDSESVRSGSASLSGKPSMGSLRAVANGAIGSERKELKDRSRERQSVDSYTATSVSSEEYTTIGGKLVEIKVESAKGSVF